MIRKKVEEAINQQINAELYSAYIYASMSAWFESRNLPGFANWMRIQVQEEVVHAQKFYTFLKDRGGRILLKAIEGPPTDWDSPLAVFEAAYAHEQKVTGLIGDLVDLAVKEKDHASQVMLQWFVTEQVEEEASADAVVQKLKLLGDSKDGLFLLDREMATRVFTPPAAPAGD